MIEAVPVDKEILNCDQPWNEAKMGEAQHRSRWNCALISRYIYNAIEINDTPKSIFVRAKYMSLFESLGGPTTVNTRGDVLIYTTIQKIL